MFAPDAEQIALNILCEKLPVAYVVSLELLRPDAFVAQLQERFGLTLKQDEFPSRSNSFPFLYWDDPAHPVYKTPFSEIQAPGAVTTAALQAHFGESVFCYQPVGIARGETAFARVEIPAEVYFSLFDSLFDLAQTSASLTFVENGAGNLWFIPENYYPNMLLSNFALLPDQLPYQRYSWELELARLNLPRCPVAPDFGLVIRENGDSHPKDTVSTLYDYVVDWFFDRLPGPRDNFEDPEVVLAMVVKLANDVSFDGKTYHDDFHGQDYTLNFYLARLVDSLTIREDGLTGMEDPDNQIAACAETFWNQLDRRFSKAQWISRFDRG